MSTQRNGWLASCLVIALATAAIASEQKRSGAHNEYADVLWDFVNEVSPYTTWTVASEALDIEVGPPSGEHTKTYLNGTATRGDNAWKSLIVTEHLGEDGDAPVAITVRYRAKDGYHGDSQDWYWAHYLPDGTALKTVADKSPFAKRGFVVFEEDGRIWVFRRGTAELAEFQENGEPAKHVIRPAAGPLGMTVKGPDEETVEAYLRVCAR